MSIFYRRAALKILLALVFTVSARASASTQSDRLAGFNRAVKYYNSANYRTALKLFLELNRERANPVLSYYTGVCSYELGDYKRALSFLSTLEVKDSLFSFANYYEAETMIALQNPAEAVEYLKISLSKDSTYTLTRIELIKTLCNLNRFDEAEEFARKSNSEVESMTLCQCLLGANKYEDAYRFLAGLITQDSTNALAKIMLAETYYETQKYSLAADEYSSILETSGQSPLLIRKLSLCYGNMGGKQNLEVAVNMMKRYFKLAADSSSEDLENIGTWYFDLSEFGSAELYFRSAVRSDSLNASAHFNLGLTLLKSDKLNEAEEHLSQAYSLSQGSMRFSMSVLKSLAAAELRKKNYGDAIEATGRYSRFFLKMRMPYMGWDWHTIKENISKKHRCGTGDLWRWRLGRRRIGRSKIMRGKG